MPWMVRYKKGQFFLASRLRTDSFFVIGMDFQPDLKIISENGWTKFSELQFERVDDERSVGGYIYK